MMRQRRKLLLAISLLLCCALLFGTANRVATANPSCEQASQRTVFLTVENKAGAPVDNLRAEDLSLLEDKTARAILKLESKTNESLAIAILIDVSISQERTLPQIRLAAQKFVETLLQSKKARFAVVSFTGEATAEESLTDDPSKLQAAISRAEFVPPLGYRGGGVLVSRTPPMSSPGQALAGSTAIWDAVWVTTDQIMKPATESRRAIVLFSDGEDTSSAKQLTVAVKYAARYNVAVFAIGKGDQDFGGVDRNSLKKVAEQTGGRAFFPKKPEEMTAALRQVDQEIRSQYLLTYCSAEGGAANTTNSTTAPLSHIKIQLNNSPALKDLRLLYRQFGW